ncbi:uncharacterized protein LOC100213554 isoform X3 [Hydra vulgaris]|uniref:uncharacterized protein LOC100213554 isoform X3 n=1 Tax=Hydra vulgaris TaxID=6087 RepID=UPI001F5E4A50|nr:uncharacterized protein LOC100213554 isoform X3 [Hydra vulgaris]
MIFIELCVALALSILALCNGHKNATINETAAVLNKEYIKTTGEKETLQNSTDKRSSQKSDGSNDAKSNDDLYVSGLTEQIFKNIDGYKVKDVVSAPNYPDNPDEQNAIPNIDIPSTGYKGYTNFGERIFGYFKAPLDGEYIFNISSNNNGQLMISTNTDKANLRIYAEVKGPVIVKYGEFDHLEKQGSMPIPMKAGEMYYLQVLHKALFGLNHVQVGALFPDKTKHYPLESKYFFTLKDMKKEGEPLDGNGDPNNNSSNSGGGLGSDGGGGGGAGGGNSSAGVADPLEAALDAGQKAGIANGAEAGSKAGENAGKRAGEDAGAKAGAEAGLRAAASALGISVEQLKEQKGFKFRFYSANFKCSQPGGYVCKYAISAEEDNTVQLNPRESAATFILRKPGLSGKIGSASFELDYRRGVFLKKDGSVLTVGANDGSKQFAKLASFSIDSQNSVFPATYGIRLYENPDVYVCHADGTSDLVISKLSDNCAFFMVPIELDMNSFQPSCKDFCQQEEKPLAQNRAPNNNFAPEDNKEATIETLHLLDALARHAASVATEKTVQDRIASERIAAIARLQAEHKMKADSHFFENLHHELDEGQHMRGQQYITVHFRNKAGPPGKIRIKSSIKPEGYLLGEDTFKLRIVFKHQFLSEVIFSGVDERDKPQQILLDGQKELKITPSANPTDMKDVVVTAVQDPNGHSSAYLRSISGSPILPVTSPLKGIDNPQAKKNLTSELNLKGTNFPDIYEFTYDQDVGQKKGIIASLSSNNKTNKLVRKLIPVSNTGRFYIRKPEIKESTQFKSEGGGVLLSRVSYPLINPSKSYETFIKPFDDFDNLTDEPDDEVNKEINKENEKNVIKKAFVNETVFSDNLLNEKVEEKDNDIEEIENLSDEIFPLEGNSDERLLRDYSLSRDYHSVKNITEALNDHVVKDPDLVAKLLKKNDTGGDPLVDDPVVGDPVVGDPVVGDPVVGDSHVNQDKQFLRFDLQNDGSGLGENLHSNQSSGEHLITYKDTAGLKDEIFNKRGHYPSYVDVFKTSENYVELPGELKDGVLSHQDGVLSHQDVVLSHQDNVLSHQDNGLLHQDSVLSLKDAYPLENISSRNKNSENVLMNQKNFKNLPSQISYKTKKILKTDNQSDFLHWNKNIYNPESLISKPQNENYIKKNSNQTEVKSIATSTVQNSVTKEIKTQNKTKSEALVVFQKSKERKDQSEKSQLKENHNKLKTNGDAQGIINDLKLFLNVFKNSSLIGSDSFTGKALPYVENLLNSEIVNKQLDSKSISKKKFINILKTLEENNHRAKLKTLSEFLRRYTMNDENQRKRYEAWQNKHALPLSSYYAAPITGFRRSFNNYNQGMPKKINKQFLNKIYHPPFNTFQRPRLSFTNLARHMPLSYKLSPHINPVKSKTLYIKAPYISSNWPRFNIVRPKPARFNQKSKFAYSDATTFSNKPNIRSFYNTYKIQSTPRRHITYFQPYPMPYFNYWNEKNNYKNILNNFRFNNNIKNLSNKNKLYYSLSPVNNLHSKVPFNKNVYTTKHSYRTVDNREGEFVKRGFKNKFLNTADNSASLDHKPVVRESNRIYYKKFKVNPLTVVDREKSHIKMNNVSVNLQGLEYIKRGKGTGFNKRNVIVPLYRRRLFRRSIISSPLFLRKRKPLNLHTKNLQFSALRTDKSYNLVPVHKTDKAANVTSVNSSYKRDNIYSQFFLHKTDNIKKKLLTSHKSFRNKDSNDFINTTGQRTIKKYVKNSYKEKQQQGENQKFKNKIQANKENSKKNQPSMIEFKGSVKMLHRKSNDLKQFISKRSHMMKHVEQHPNVRPERLLTRLTGENLSFLENGLNKKINSFLPKHHLTTDLQKYKEINDFLGQKLNQVMNTKKELQNTRQFKTERSNARSKQFGKQNDYNNFVRAFSSYSNPALYTPQQQAQQQQKATDYIKTAGGFSSTLQPLKNSFKYKTNPIIKNQPISMNNFYLNHAQNIPTSDFSFQMFMKQNRYLAAYLAAFYKKNPLLFRRLNTKYYFNNMSPEQYAVYVNKFVEPLYPTLRWRIANYMLADYFIRNGYPVEHLGSIYSEPLIKNVIHDYQVYKQITPVTVSYPQKNLYNPSNTAYTSKITNMYTTQYPNANSQPYSNMNFPKFTSTLNYHQDKVQPGNNWQIGYQQPGILMNHMRKSYLSRQSRKNNILKKSRKGFFPKESPKRVFNQMRMYIPKRYVFPAKLIEGDFSWNRLGEFKRTVIGNKKMLSKREKGNLVVKEDKSVIGNVTDDSITSFSVKKILDSKQVPVYENINSDSFLKNEANADNSKLIRKELSQSIPDIKTKTGEKFFGTKSSTVKTGEKTASLKRSSMLNNPKDLSSIYDKLEQNSSANISINSVDVNDTSKGYADDISMQDLLIIEKMFDTAQAFFMSEKNKAKKNKTLRMDTSLINNQKFPFVAQNSSKNTNEILPRLADSFIVSPSEIVNSSKIFQNPVNSNQKPIKVLLNDSKLFNKNPKTFDFKTIDSETFDSKTLDSKTFDIKNLTTMKPKNDFPKVVSQESSVQNKLLKEKNKQSELLDEKSKQSELLKEKIKQSELLDEKGKQSELLNEKGKQSELLNEKSKQSELLNEKGKQSELLNEKSKQSELLNEKGKQSEPFKVSAQNELKSNRLLTTPFAVKKEKHKSMNRISNNSSRTSRADSILSDKKKVSEANHENHQMNHSQANHDKVIYNKIEIRKNQTTKSPTSKPTVFTKETTTLKQSREEYHRQNDNDEATSELEDAKEALQTKNERENHDIIINQRQQSNTSDTETLKDEMVSEHDQSLGSRQSERVPTEQLNLEAEKNHSAHLTATTKDDEKLDDLHQTLDLDRLLKSFDLSPSDISNEDWFESTFRPDATTKLDLKITTSKFLTDVKRKHKHVESPTSKQQMNNIVKIAESSEQNELQNLIKESIGSGINNELNPALNLVSSAKASDDKNQKVIDNEVTDSSNIEGLKGAEITNNEIGKLVGDLPNDFEVGEKDPNGFFDDAIEKGDVINQIKFQDQKEVHDLKLDLSGDSGSNGKQKPFSYIDSKRNKKNSKPLSVENINQAFDNAALSKDSLHFDRGHHEENPLQVFDSGGDKFTENTRTPEDISKTKEEKSRKNSFETKYQSTDINDVRDKWREVNGLNKEKDSDEIEEATLTTTPETTHDIKPHPLAAKEKDNLLDNYFKEVENSQHDSNFEKEYSQRQSKRKQKIQVTLAMINDIEKQIDTIMNVTEASKKLNPLKKKGKEAVFNELVYGSTQKNVLEDSATSDNKLDNLEEIRSHSKKSKKLKLSAAPKDENVYTDKLEDYDDSDSNKHLLDISSMVASKDRKERFQQAQALFKIQKDEANEDLLKLKEITQDGLQSMFAKAVAKQQKFMDEVQGPPASVVGTQESSHPDFEHNKLIAIESSTLESPVANSLSYNTSPRLWRPLDDGDYITDEDETPARKNLVLDEDQYNKRDALKWSDRYQDKIISDDDLDDDSDDASDNDTENDDYLEEKDQDA